MDDYVDPHLQTNKTKLQLNQIMNQLLLPQATTAWVYCRGRSWCAVEEILCDSPVVVVKDSASRRSWELLGRRRRYERWRLWFSEVERVSPVVGFESESERRGRWTVFVVKVIWWWGGGWNDCRRVLVVGRGEAWRRRRQRFFSFFPFLFGVREWFVGWVFEWGEW